MAIEVAATALVDFYNVADMRRGANLVYTDYEDALFRIVARVEEVTRRLQPRPDDLMCRLYGGWYGQIGETEGYQLLTAAIRKNFPSRRTVRIRMTLATALLSRPDVLLTHSFRRIPGLPRFTTAVSPSACGAVSACSLALIRRWQRGGCPESGCTVSENDVFCRDTQKMVDTSICCDVIHIVTESPEDWAIVVSDDDDMIPGLLAAARGRDTRLLQLRPPRQYSRYYDAVLTEASVVLREW